jgi:hypothetical protein
VTGWKSTGLCLQGFEFPRCCCRVASATRAAVGATARGHPGSSHSERVTQLGLARPTPCGTRARNLRIRGPTPCPLGQGGLFDGGAEGSMSSRSCCCCCACHHRETSSEMTPRGFELRGQSPPSPATPGHSVTVRAARDQRTGILPKGTRSVGEKTLGQTAEAWLCRGSPSLASLAEQSLPPSARRASERGASSLASPSDARAVGCLF